MKYMLIKHIDGEFTILFRSESIYLRDTDVFDDEVYILSHNPEGPKILYCTHSDVIRYVGFDSYYAKHGPSELMYADIDMFLDEGIDRFYKNEIIEFEVDSDEEAILLAMTY